MHAADGGEAFEVGQREHRRAIDHPVDQQRVGPGIDLRDAAVVTLEVQVGRRDRAVEVLMGSAGRGDTARLTLRLFGRRALTEGPAWFSTNLAGVGWSLDGLHRSCLAEGDGASGASEEIASRDLHRHLVDQSLMR